MHQHLPAPANGSTVPRCTTGPPLDVSKLPLWCRVLLGRVQQGIPIEDARKMDGSRRSTATIVEAGQYHPDWYRTLMDAQQGCKDGQPLIPASDITRAHAWTEEERRHKLSMEASERYAHPYMRLGAEIRRDVGHGSQQQAPAVQVNIGAICYELASTPRAAPVVEGHVPLTEAQDDKGNPPLISPPEEA